MSEITERVMRGDYVSRAECFEHADEIERTFACYGAAMDAFDAAQKLPPCTRCQGEYGYAECTCDICAKPFCAHCLDRHEEADHGDAPDAQLPRASTTKPPTLHNKAADKAAVDSLFTGRTTL